VKQKGGARRRSLFFLFLALLALLLWVFDRATNILSDLLGRWVCGSSYMQPVDGTVGDLSCGFNMDIYLALVLAISMIVSTTLYVIAGRRA